MSQMRCDDVERFVLSSMLLSEKARIIALEALEECDFALNAHRATYLAVKSLTLSNQGVDVVSVSEWLYRSHTACFPEGVEVFLAKLSETGSGENITAKCKLIRDKALRRKMHVLSQELGSELQTSPRTGEEIYGDAQQKMIDLGTDKIKTSTEHVEKIIPVVLGEIEASQKTGGRVGVESGITKLDTMTSGFHRGESWIIAARPSMGKTSLALSIARTVSRATSVAFFSLEMPKTQLINRLASSITKIDFHKIRSGQLSKRELADLGSAFEDISRLKLYINDTPALRPIDIYLELTKLKMLGGVDLCITDYLQLMRQPGKKQREQEVSSISQSLKAIGKRLDIPMITLAQLSRRVEEREGKRPQLSDLRESGSIEQDADGVVFLHRDRDSDSNECDLIIGKQRNGPIGTVKTFFDPAFIDFTDLEEKRNEQTDDDDLSDWWDE